MWETGKQWIGENWFRRTVKPKAPCLLRYGIWGKGCTKAKKKHRSSGGSRKGTRYLRRCGWSGAEGWGLAKSLDGKQTPGPLPHPTQPDNCWLPYLSKPNRVCMERQDTKQRTQVKVEAWTLRTQPSLPDTGSENSHTQELLAKRSTLHLPTVKHNCPAVCCRTLHQAKTSNKTKTPDSPTGSPERSVLLGGQENTGRESEPAHRLQHHHHWPDVTEHTIHPEKNTLSFQMHTEHFSRQTAFGGSQNKPY